MSTYTKCKSLSAYHSPPTQPIPSQSNQPQSVHADIYPSTSKLIVSTHSIPNKRKALGSYAEQQAWNYLQTQDYQLIARNWKGQRGEIDLTLAQDQTLIWVEVRCTTQPWLSHPLQAITPHKCQQVSRCAQEFLLKEEQLAEKYDEFRFDVIAIGFTSATPSPTQSTIHIEHVMNAFYASWGF